MNRTTFKAANMFYPALSGAAPLHARRGFVAAPPHQTAAAADRIMLTLLALSLLLLAFFVVLTSTATIDQRRMGEAAQSMQTARVLPRVDAQTKTTEEPMQSAEPDTAQRATVAVLRAAIIEMFAAILSGDQSAAMEKLELAGPDRVEVDTPIALFFENGEAEAVLQPLQILEKIVAVLGAPPVGYRMELVVRASAPTVNGAVTQARLAALADGLVRRGLAPSALSVGTLEAEHSGASMPDVLRFTFLVLASDDALAGVGLMAGSAKP